MNTTAITGRLARSPEAHQTKGGTAVTELRVAVDDERGAKTSFIAVTCYGKLAETASRYLDKGRLVAVTGRLVVDEWATDDGHRHSRAHVVARAVDFLDRRPSTGDEGDEAPADDDYGDYGPDEEPY
jgi:single-strand DNA-binding protein